jgi:transposase InsO family protein
LEQRVLAVRGEHSAWGGRKIRHWLLRAGHGRVPSASTITEILRRHGMLDEGESSKHRAFRRFEAAQPNELWQMDFKGHFGLQRGRCHALTVLDDHSRFAIGLEACTNERGSTVKQRLSVIFGCYGLPRTMLMDNGSPWGSGEYDYTPLTVWLLRLGIRVIHGRPYHPQTQGKDERFHRTLEAEVLRGRQFRDTGHCQQAFRKWLPVYNYERPHEALQMGVPGDRYRPSRRSFPRRLPPVEYGPDDHVRRVQHGGEISFRGRLYKVPKAFRGEAIALRPTATDGLFQLYFCQRRFGELDLRRRRTRRVGGG